MKGHIRQRGPKTWALVIELGRDADGKRRQKWITVHGGKRDAQRELTRLLHELDTGGKVDLVRMNVAEYLEHWLEEYARVNVGARTFQRYQELVRVHLIPELGRHPLPKLQPLHIQAAYSQLLREGRRDGKGGLAPATVLQTHRILRKALQQAVKWQLLNRNPCEAVEPPRVQRTEMQVLDEADAARLLAAARETRLYVPIVLAIATGMRRGELLALRWEDLDLAQGRIVVNRSLEVTREGLRFKSPKTARGRRIVTLPEFAVQALHAHRTEQEREKQLFGGTYQDQQLVVAEPDGAPVNPDHFTKRFTYLVRKLDLPPVRFHDLRHTHASHLLRQNVHPKVVSERLGHSTISITLDTYSHVLPGLQEEAARKIHAVFGASSPE